MRIGIVCYPTFGGSGVVATELGVELSKRGHNVHFLTYKKPVRLDTSLENIHFHEVHVPDYPLFHYQPYELALSSALVDMVRLHKIDLLHVHYAIPHAYAAYMAKQMLAEYQIEIPISTSSRIHFIYVKNTILPSIRKSLPIQVQHGREKE